MMDVEEAKRKRQNARTDTKEMDIGKYMDDLARKSNVDRLLDEYNRAKEAGDTDGMEKALRLLKKVGRGL